MLRARKRPPRSGRSFRSGLWACAWAIVLGAPLLIAAWLAEALRWYQQGQGTVLDGAGGLGIGVNLGDAVWWPLVFLALWAVPLGWLARPPGAHGPASTTISPRRPERRTSRALSRPDGTADPEQESRTSVVR